MNETTTPARHGIAGTPETNRHAGGAAAAALDLGRRIAAVDGRRAGKVLALNAIGGLTEGAGVLALAPLLRVLGVGADGASLDPWFFALVLTGYVSLAGGAALIARTRAMTTHVLVTHVLDRLRVDLHTALLAMEWTQFRKLRSAEMQQTMTGEIGRIAVAASALGNLLGALLIMPFMAAAALFLSLPLSAAALVVVVAVAFATRELGARGWRLGRNLGAVNRAAMADLADSLAGLRLIKIFQAEAAQTARLNDRFDAVKRNNLAHHRAQTAERAILQTAAAAAAAAGLYLSVFVLRIPLAESLTLMLAFGRLLQAALRCLASWRQLTSATAALASYDETLAACRAAAEPAAAGVTPPPLRRDIRLSGVVVRYGEEGRPALDHVDAVIPAGKVTALIGPSGAGKSTLVDLVLGLTAPGAGRVSVDGVDLTAGLRPAWRGATAACPQDPFLFHDTVRANLRLARPDADDDALWAALEMAAADFVRALPDGLDTVVGDRGARFSGGERQRLALARALLRQPAFLVLDEATASLDDESAAAAIDRLHGKTTVLVVAHRLSAVRRADHVLLLEAGRLVAEGNWDEVRAQAGPRLAAIGMTEDA